MILLAALLALAATDEVPFAPSAERFADAPACKAHLEAIVRKTEGYEAAEGPYAIADGDVRVHLVGVEGAGHRIWEYRCLAKDLSARTWHHAMEADEEEFTLESAARSAEWLKKDAP